MLAEHLWVVYISDIYMCCLLGQLKIKVETCLFRNLFLQGRKHTKQEICPPLVHPFHIIYVIYCMFSILPSAFSLIYIDNIACMLYILLCFTKSKWQNPKIAFFSSLLTTHFCHHWAGQKARARLVLVGRRARACVLIGRAETRVYGRTHAACNNIDYGGRRPTWQERQQPDHG